MDCLVWEGLGNRINAITSSLSTSEEDITLYWSVNSHLPFRFEEVFDPIERINVVNVRADKFTYSQHPQRICYYYLCNPKQLDLSEFAKEVLKYYKVVFDRIRLELPEVKLPDDSVGVNYRHFLKQSKGVNQFHSAYNEWIKDKKLTPSTVFISGDSQKHCEQLVKLIPNSFILDNYIGLSSDLDRNKGNFDVWVRSLQTLSKCKSGVFSSCKVSTACDVLRGYDIDVDYHEKFDHHRSMDLESAISREIGIRNAK